MKLNGMLVFACLEKPVDCFDKDKGQEYKCGVVVDEDTADSFAAEFPKQAARKVKRSEFEGIYKCAPPEGSEKNLYVITLKKNSQITDKATQEKIPLPVKYRPRLLQKQGATLVDLTSTEKAGNGSYGTVSYEAGETRYGLVARLKNVLVTKLIPYEGGGGSDYEVGDEFADDSASDDNGGSVKVPPSAKTKEAPKAKPKAAPKPQDDDMDEDLPFITGSAYFDQTTSKARKMAKYDF
jgi:hypothetical protein